MSSPQLAHMVYFSLENNSAEEVDHLVNEIKTYLDDHPGLVYFSCGTLNRELNRPVNDQDFDVCLNTVFADRAAHDAYQVAPRHLEFIERNKPKWKRVRVFDSDLC